MLLAFDLDGTLVDSHLAVVESYRAAGVEPPEDFWGKPWREWLADEKAHEHKNREFTTPCMLKKTRRLRTMDLFRQEHSIVLTGASLDAARAVLSFYELRPRSLFTELNADHKVEVLNQLPAGIYFDDDKAICSLVKARTQWTVMHVQS